MKRQCLTASPPRTAAEAAVLDTVDARVRAIALSLGGREMHYPSLIARPVLERAEYPQAFGITIEAVCHHDR